MRGHVCGIDRASERHAVCMLDDAGRKATAFQAAHTTDGLEQLVARLRRHGDPARLPVAIEWPGGRLVDRLLEAGHPVVPVSPGTVKAWRDAEVRSGAKVYADALARGCIHPRAIRILARAWIRVIWRCWVDRVPYDPAKHGNARKLTETAASAAQG
jgi:hypothetical protein